MCYFSGRGRFREDLIGSAEVLFAMMTESMSTPQLRQRHPVPQRQLKSNEFMKYAWTKKP